MLSNDILPCCFQDEVKNPKLLTDDARPTAIGYPSVSNDLKKIHLHYISKFVIPRPQIKSLNPCRMGSGFHIL